MTHCRKLTRRKRDVLKLVRVGLKNGAIAAALKLSVSGVRKHLQSLHRKTRTSDKAELILNLWHSCQSLQRSSPTLNLAPELAGRRNRKAI